MALSQAPQAHKQVDGELVGEARRRFMASLLTDLRALEQMVEQNMFERGVSRIGAEQEIFLVDGAYHPAPGALRILEAIHDPHYTTELGLFNLEINADPQPFAGKGLANDGGADLRALRRACAPSPRRSTSSPSSPASSRRSARPTSASRTWCRSPRYQMLNRVMNAARGDAFDFSIKGIDELTMRHDSVMVEACNASFQVHLQLAEPERFAHFYNVAQLLLAPVLAVGTNSPVLFGRRLWAETRIALFEQACDIRTRGLHLREATSGSAFGREWLQGSVVDLFKENLTRFRALVGTELDEDALETLKQGKIPKLRAMLLHSGTIYRWNRACYGISENGLAAPAHRAPRPAVRPDRRGRGRERRLLARADERARPHDRGRPLAARLRPRAGQPLRRGARRPLRPLHVARRQGVARAAARPRPAPAARAGGPRPRRRRPCRLGPLPRHHREAGADAAHRLALDAAVARRDEGPRDARRPAHRARRRHDRAAEDRAAS